jgi:hypothetical protein
VIVLPSPTDDNIVESMLAMMHCRYQAMLVMTLLRRIGRGAMSMPSHASDGATEVIWLRHNVSAESCW